MNLATVLIRLKKRKRGDSTESYRRVFKKFLPHFDTHISFIIVITHVFLSINICWAQKAYKPIFRFIIPIYCTLLDHYKRPCCKHCGPRSDCSDPRTPVDVILKTEPKDMVGYSLAGRRRCGTFEFRCKKNLRLFKIENNQQQKTIVVLKSY